MNEGEIPQYYVTDDHEPIIDKKIFDLVQIEREKRNGVSYSENKCSTGHVTEDEIKERFVEAYNSLDRSGVIRNVESIKQLLMSSDKEKAEQKKLQDEYDKCEKKLYKLIDDNSTHAQNQDEYNRKYRELTDKSSKIQEKIDKLEEKIKDKEDRVKY